VATRKKNTKDHRDRKNPRSHELWTEQKKEMNAQKRIGA